MSEDELNYITTKTTSRQNKKRRQQKLPPQSLYDMFPSFDKELIEQCYKSEKANIQNTVQKLLELQGEPEVLENVVDIQDDDIQKYIKEFEKLENYENYEQLNEGFIFEEKSEEYNTLKAEVSMIWLDEPELKDVLNSYDKFYEETKNEDNSNSNNNNNNNNIYLDLLGVDINQIPPEFINNIQSYMHQLINQQQNQIQNDYNEFPILIPPDEGQKIQLKKNEDILSQQMKISNYGNPQNLRKYINSWTQQQQQQQQQQQSKSDSSSLLQKLCEEFPFFSYSKIKFALEQLGSYDYCKGFLTKYYNDEYYPKIIQRPKIVVQQDNQTQFKQYTISEKYKNLSANELRQLFTNNRQKIKELRNNSQVVNKCAGKYGNVAMGVKLNHFYQTQYEKIQQLEYEGIKLFVALIVAEQSFTKIDLHGIYGGEVEELLDELIEQIKIYKTRLKKINIDVEFIVGRGLHSKNKVPVIGPIALQYFRSCNYQIVGQYEGRMIVKI
ncbi:unnamed protein product [Paramecium primaurelia]|uniref:Smr domain-containing protein n=1 Tax=Paramecium primaurelia TaxID=5886 RepID=A0A8S1LXF2_PARPR|nr:unnamed protein product [Paramecium primaurelia]